MQPTITELQQTSNGTVSSGASLQPQSSNTQQSTSSQLQQDVLGASAYKNYDSLTVSGNTTPVATASQPNGVSPAVWWFVLFLLLVAAAVLWWRYLLSRRQTSSGASAQLSNTPKVDYPASPDNLYGENNEYRQTKKVKKHKKTAKTVKKKLKASAKKK